MSSRRSLGAVVGLATLGIGALGASGCATNPVSGKSQLSLYSEAEEIELGREEDQKTLVEVGLYGGDTLQAYVQQLGLQLAASSERPKLPWTFRVLDDPSVNAFALPGGYVYVTRGILTHLTSEAELATVLGHEIGHVTARHSVSELSKATMASLGLSAAAILAGSDDLAAIGGIGLELLFSKFSRHDESQADSLGVRYALQGGFDPRPMTDVMTMLGRVTDAEGGRLPTWLASHPAPENRRQQIEQQVAALNVDLGQLAVNRDAYLTRLQNMEFGEDPREGYFGGNAFYHPQLKFSMRFPKGWETENSKASVVAVSPDSAAAISLELADGKDPSSARKAFFGGEGIEEGDDWDSGLDLPASGGYFRATTDDGEMQGLAAFVSYGGQVYQLLALATDAGWQSHSDVLEQAVASFAALKDPRLLRAEPKKLALVKLTEAMTLQEFGRRYPSTVPIETVALINQVQAADVLPAGMWVKRVVGGVLPKP
jgi:predicted Zn-dependent protease